MARVVSIDPGVTGALTLIDTVALTLRAERMPTRVERRSRKDKTFIDEDALTDLILAMKPDVAWIEDVFAIGRGNKGPEGRQDGVVGAFSFGEGKGVLKGVLGALRVPRRYASPSVWKGKLGASSDKAQSKALAHRFFPRSVPVLSSSGKAEAALIGLYGCLSDGIVFNTAYVVPEQHHGAKKTH